MNFNNIKTGTLLGIKFFDGGVQRCTLTGKVNADNKVLVTREFDNKIFAVTTDLIVWINS